MNTAPVWEIGENTGETATAADWAACPNAWHAFAAHEAAVGACAT